jgi:hypothetical protein
MKELVLTKDAVELLKEVLCYYLRDLCECHKLLDKLEDTTKEKQEIYTNNRLFLQR